MKIPIIIFGSGTSVLISLFFNDYYSVDLKIALLRDVSYSGMGQGLTVMVGQGSHELPYVTGGGEGVGVGFR